MARCRLVLLSDGVINILGNKTQNIPSSLPIKAFLFLPFWCFWHFLLLCFSDDVEHVRSAEQPTTDSRQETMCECWATHFSIGPNECYLAHICDRLFRSPTEIWPVLHAPSLPLRIGSWQPGSEPDFTLFLYFYFNKLSQMLLQNLQLWLETNWLPSSWAPAGEAAGCHLDSNALLDRISAHPLRPAGVLSFAGSSQGNVRRWGAT